MHTILDEHEGVSSCKNSTTHVDTKSKPSANVGPPVHYPSK